jgi:uncharacterized protein (TIGR04222 family)
MRSFQNNLSSDPAKNPLSLALLEGGSGQMLITVLMSLQARGSILIEKQKKEWRCISKNHPGEIEADLMRVWTHVEQGGDRGCSIASIQSILIPMVRKRENELALLGLRCTPSERLAVRAIGVLPFLAVIGLGVAKIFVGVERNKPVGFLVIGVFMTVALFFILLDIAAGITPKGKKFLLSMKQAASQNQLQKILEAESPITPTDEGIKAMSLGVALYGAGFANNIGFSEISRINREFVLGMSPSSGSGCGGDSGCGDGGCGGCGGCGGD